MYNKMIIRMSSALLALLITASTAVSCGKTADTAESNTEIAASQTETEIVDERHSVKDSLPDNLDFNGDTINIYIIDMPSDCALITGPEQENGEIIDDSIWTRNFGVEEKLDCKLEYTTDASSNGKIPAIVRKLVLSGDSGVDLIIGDQSQLCSIVSEGLFMNALDNKYLDFTKPWWWSDYMENISISDRKRYCLVSDYFIAMLRGARLLYFNRQMYKNIIGNPAELYEMTFDGVWTVDKLIEIVRKSYIDLNGNSQADIDDQFGFITYVRPSSVKTFVYTSDVALTERDENGYITFVAPTERAVTLLEKLIELHYDDACYLFNDGDTHYQKFVDGEAMFLGNADLYDIDTLRDMEQDYGMLVYPKFDETQTDYHTIIHDSAALGVIPKTTAKFDMLGAVLEALSAESYYSVIPAYYENAMKIKYTRDDMSSMMLDLIHDSINTEFTFIYASSLGCVDTNVAK